MLSSKKLTFSLTSFIVLIAFGLVCFAPSVFADGRDDDNDGRVYDLDVTISAAESMIDVSYKGTDNDIQIATGRDRTSRIFDAGDALAITLLVEFSHVVNLATPYVAAEEDALVPLVDIDEETANEPKPSGGDFGEDDLFVAAYDKEGRALGVLSLAEAASAIGDTGVGVASISQFRDAGGPGRQFLVRIDESLIVDAYAQRGGPFEIYSFVFFIPKGIGTAPWVDDTSTDDAAATRGIRKASLDHAIAHFGPLAHHHLNNPSNQFQVDLVDDDQGNPMYNAGVSETAIAADGDPGTAGSGTPGVVAVQSFRERTGLIETGVFDVRIILTEEPKGIADIIKDPSILIDVVNGSATKLTVGATIKGGTGDDTAQATSNELTVAMVDYYPMEEANPVAPVAAAGLPQATGRDNKYHQYFATITPDPGVENKDLIVSVKQFADNVKPVSKQYIPLTAEQRIAVTLTDDQQEVRDARIANETLAVMVNTAADTTSDAAVAKQAGVDAYETRVDDDEDDTDGEGKNGLFDLNPNLDRLDVGLVIPANGYLVLVRGADAAASSVVSVSAKIAEKLTDAQEDYNVVYGFELPHPATDLDTFFRNGGTIQLVHGDLPDATDSGTDESKAKPEKDEKPDTEHADYAGYDGATTKAYAEGEVVISEVMWGGFSSQYLELHNTTDAPIEIDHLEWAIAIGSAPDAFTVIDTIGNNPTTGYWEVPGSDFIILDAIANVITESSPATSMSRVNDATSATGLAEDGTAEASWATSIRRDTVRETGNANIVPGRIMIGTPGAANAYVEPAPEETPPEEGIPAAAVATASDIMISEIMVASDDGRLPQWIEITNDSAAAVSLSGWSLEIENDAADADVVGAGASIGIDLGDVEIGAGQVALVVSKEGRDTSGIGDSEGDLRADRIIDVQSQVSPDNARYSLISEMGFMLSLIPPRTGAVRTPGDAAGNLGGGWEIPMSEDGRSSLIRSDKDADAGTDAADWVLASDTLLNGAYQTTYYGHADDVGTPGYDAGGALPVELSGFNAARDRVTGAVVITWSTQSELNNAGFFIKRSQQTKGKFVAVNPTMIAGAGTTAEKQSYTYTDATADPNVIYFYQIEDVSLDGNRQTLTRAHRLKGHIGAAGKATTTWGELKSSRD